jgi:hypothetical protein
MKLEGSCFATVSGSHSDYAPDQVTSTLDIIAWLYGILIQQCIKLCGVSRRFSWKGSSLIGKTGSWDGVKNVRAVKDRGMID